MNKTIPIVIASLIVGLLIGYNIPGKNNNSFDYKNKEYGSGSMINSGMSGNGGHMMHMSVSSEQEFIEGMIPHHQEAVDTAKEVIARGGTTAEVKTLVENIVKAQEAEIADMKAWYKSWYGKDYVDNNSYRPMMRELSKLSGAEIDKAFLEDMIMHHMGAIMMAKSVQPYVEHDEIKNLTTAVITTQSQEINQMREMLQSF